jgi:hypothetical protein
VGGLKYKIVHSNEGQDYVEYKYLNDLLEKREDLKNNNNNEKISFSTNLAFPIYRYMKELKF